MKNIFSSLVLAALVTGVTLPAQAQIYKGATFIGGSIGMKQRSERPVHTQDDESTTYFSASINPKVGRYVTNNLAVGINLHSGFMNTEYRNQSSLHSKQNSYTGGVSVFTRYTKFIIPKLAFFTEANIGYVHTWNRAERKDSLSYESNYAKVNGFTVSINPGIIFMPTPRLGFEASYGKVGYNYMSSKVDRQQMYSLSAPSRNISAFGVDLSSSTLTIGFNYYFGNRPRIKVQEADDE